MGTLGMRYAKLGGKPLRTRLSAEERAALAARAKADGCTESAVVREALRRYLKGWPSAPASHEQRKES